MSYSIPRDVYILLESAFNQDRAKADIFAKAIEGSIQAIEFQAEEAITHKKEALKAELYNELRTELATKEFVRAEINGLRSELRTEMTELRGEIKHNTLLLKILIAFAVFALTLFNPSFVKLVEVLTK